MSNRDTPDEYHGARASSADSPPSSNLLDWAQALSKDGHRVALATVVRTWGSSPCPLGSQLVVVDDGRFEGSVSGGCVEGRVIERASRLMHEGGAELVGFGVSNEEAWGVGLPCGGRIEVWVESLD